MNYFKLVIAILISTNFIYGQSTRELFSLPGYEIIMVAINTAEAPDANMSLYFDSDTLYCGESVLRFNTSYGENIYLDIDDGKVMIVDTCDSKRLLFDFDVSIGDSLTVHGRKTEVVAIGDTIFNDNKTRKTYSLKAPDGVSPESELYIEGIGSQFTGFDFTKADSGYSTYFSCINDMNGQIHLSPFSDPSICERFSMFASSTINSADNQNLVLYPNPTYGHINVIRQSNSTEYLSIFNSQSELVLEMDLDSETNFLDIVEFPSGIYYLIVLDKRNQVLSHSKLVKL